MNLSVIGLGYVGVVCSVCFAKEGHSVIGVDIDKIKIDLINKKKAPIIEAMLEEYIQKGVDRKKLMATSNLEYAIQNSEITFIAVGTPNKANGDIDLSYIEKSAVSIGKILKDKKDYHIIAMRSTVLPGTARDIVIPIIEKYSGKKVGIEFGYVSNPEFLREGTAIYDFYNPPKTVVGSSDKESSKKFRELYSFVSSPYFETDIEVAEMIKYADNSWHSTKVTFANEIGIICKRLGIDSHKVMNIFCKDNKLNISSYYLKPGFAFGGSCLPKDVKALTYKAKLLDENTPLLHSLMVSNKYQIERVYENFIKPIGKKKVGILGISFKADTDDLRQSPVLELAEILIGKGYLVKIYDANITKAYDKKANRHLLDNDLKHIKDRLVKTLYDIILESDIIIIGHSSEEFRSIDFNEFSRKIFIDLVRIKNDVTSQNYIGIGW